MSQPTDRPRGSDSSHPSHEPDATHMFATAVDLPAETRLEVVRQLNQSLADTTDLATQMKFAHWNVNGMDFYQLHLLFDEVAEVLVEHADRLAERATALGGQAMGTARMAATNSRIPEMDAGIVTGRSFVEETSEHLAVHAANLRADIDYAAGQGDEDTADLYTEISREVDKQLYFLESHRQAQPVGTVGERQGTGNSAGENPRSDRTTRRQSRVRQGGPPRRESPGSGTGPGRQPAGRVQQQPRQRQRYASRYRQPARRQ